MPPHDRVQALAARLREHEPSTRQLAGAALPDEIGARILWMGQQKLVFIGGSEQEWDDVVCVRYPSRMAFLEMIARHDYLAATHHREAGLERTALLCCSAGSAS